jgi:hypothetical protein
MSDHFEHKIREKLQDADFPFDQDAWAKMEKKLDAITPTSKRRGGFPWWMGGLVLLLCVSAGIAVWYNYGTNESSAQDVAMVDSLSATKIEVGAEDKVESFQKDKLLTRETDVNNSSVDLPKENSDAKITSSNTNTTTKNITSTNQTGIAATEAVDNHINDNVNTIAERTVNNTVDSVGIASIALPAAASPVELHNIQAYTAKDASIADSLSTQPAELQHIIITPKPSQRRGFALGFAAGPDYSVAPCLMLGNFGVSAGLQLQYAINNRFSISTGAFYAKKTYGATPADYEAPYSFKKVDADCKVLDVPLNLNVTLFESGKHSWAATIGGSSYFMLREEYKMYYNNNNLHKYVYDNGSQHYFSILNLGIGYQQQAARHVMWGITPYAKVPLAGVGHGNVKLTSFGFMLHVNLTQY